MRRQQPRSTISGILASKRIAVALCAAIAMVLGAMSVGATVHIGSPNVGTFSLSNQENPATAEDVRRVTSNKPHPETKTFSQQSVLTPILLAPPDSDKDKPPTLIKPDIISQTTLTLGSLNVSASVSNNNIQLDTSVTSPLSTQTSTDPTPTTSTPLDSILQTPPTNTDTTQPTSPTGSTTPSNVSSDTQVSVQN